MPYLCTCIYISLCMEWRMWKIVRSMETMHVWYAKFDISHTKLDMLYDMFLYLCQLWYVICQIEYIVYHYLWVMRWNVCILCQFQYMLHDNRCVVCQNSHTKIAKIICYTHIPLFYIVFSHLCCANTTNLGFRQDLSAVPLFPSVIPWEVSITCRSLWYYSYY